MTENQLLVHNDISELVALGDRNRLRSLLNDEHPADLAEIFGEMEAAERLFCFRLLDIDHASELLSELDKKMQSDLLSSLGDSFGLVPIIGRMSPDDAADLLAELPDDQVSKIIENIPDQETKEDIKQLLAFDEDTAGGIMSTDYLSLLASMTVGDSLVKLKEMYEDIEEDLYDLYVVDEGDLLVGRISVRDLLTNDPAAAVNSCMETDLISVPTFCDQEEAAEKLSRYDLLSLPVIDESGKLVGIITADDVIDVLKEEATEDIYQSSGINLPESGENLSYNLGKAFSARLPWLIATLMIETGSVSVITHFDNIIKETVAAASFMPLLSGVTGSVATQSTCIIIRGTANKSQINLKLALKNIFHELRVGFLLGIFCGGFTYLISLLIHSSHPELGLVVSISLLITMTVGVLIGTVMPIIFHRAGIDPAHASGPFITSILDVSTMTIYLTIVHYFLSHII